MRKRKEQQKNQKDYQMTLFDKNGKPHHDADSGTTGYQGGGFDYLSQLTRQRTLTQEILRCAAPSALELFLFDVRFKNRGDF